MNTKHSPGPWTWQDPGDPEHVPVYLRDAEGNAVMYTPYGSLATPDSRAAANLKLIADAPALLDALEHMRTCRRCGEGWADCPGGVAALDLLRKHGRIP